MTYGKSIMCLLYVARKHTVKWTDKSDLLNGLQCICKHYHLMEQALENVNSVHVYYELFYL